MSRQPSKRQKFLSKKLQENDESSPKESSSSGVSSSNKPVTSKASSSKKSVPSRRRSVSKKAIAAKSKQSAKFKKPRSKIKSKNKDLPPAGKMKTPVKKFAEVFRLQIGELVKMFFDPTKTFDDIAKALNLIDKNYRDKFTQMKPDSECQEAAAMAQGIQSNPARQANVASYLNLAARKQANGSESANRRAIAIGQQSGYVRTGNGFSRNGLPTAVEMVQVKDNLGNIVIHVDRNGKQRNKLMKMAVPFKFKSVMDCGVCHLCGQSVYAYGNDNFITGCGECEHIGAIIASLFAGMLASQGDPSMAYGYGLSHVQCNQAKSDLLSVIFNIKDLRWEYDNNGANSIAARILDGFGTGQGALHKAEYCPEYAKWWSGARKPDKKNQTIKTMVTSIKRHSELWCAAANTRLSVRLGENIKTRTDAVSGITRILQQMILSISGGTNTKVGTGNLQNGLVKNGNLAAYEISDSSSSSPGSCVGYDCHDVSQSQGLYTDERLDSEPSDVMTRCPEGAVCESSVDSGDTEYAETIAVAFKQVKHPIGSEFALLSGDELLIALRSDATVKTLMENLSRSLLLQDRFSFVTREDDDKYCDSTISVQIESSTEDMDSIRSASDTSSTGYFASRSESEGSDMEGGSRAFHWKTTKKYNRIVRKLKQYTKKRYGM